MLQHPSSDMLNVYATPGRILFGLDAVDQVGLEAAALGAKKALLVCTPSAIRHGVAGKIKDLLSKEGVSSYIYDRIGPDPDTAIVDQCTESACSIACDLIIGVGGGSALDVAKGVALTAKNGEKFNEFLKQKTNPRSVLPKILIPTTSGSGSEVSQAAVFVDKQSGTKSGLHHRCLLADTAIVDPRLVLTLPAAPTADGGLDSFIHSIEAIYSTTATLMSDSVAYRACRQIWDHLPVVFKVGTDINARQQVALGSMMAGMAFTWSGLGAIHALAYPLNIDCRLSHGRSNAVICPYVLAFNIAACPEKTRQLAAALDLGIDHKAPGEVLIRAVEGLIHQLGISTRLRDYGVDEADLPDMADRAVSSGKRLLATNPRMVTVDDALEIYRQAW